MDPIILVAIGSFLGGVAGLLVGLSISLLRRRKSKEEVQPAEAEPVLPPPPAVASRPAPKDSTELLSVWRNERTHKLLALLEGKPLSPSQLTHDQKERLSHILSGLHTLTGDLTPPPTVAASPQSVQPPERETPSLTIPAPEALPAEPIPNPQAAEGLPPVGEPAPGQAKKVYFADTLPEPVSLRQALVSNPFKINVPASSQKPAGAPKTIVEQIDEILQSKLVDSPFAGRDIQLKEAPNGMMVKIGDYEYEGIDAVPDPTIRALIKESAREWNEKVSRKR